MNQGILLWAILATLACFFLFLMYLARVAEVESLKEEVKRNEGL